MMTKFEIQSLIIQWIQTAFALLGIPTTIYAIYKLFQKDKDRESEINSLKELAENSLKSINELKIQSQEFQAQTSIMSDSNKLMERHLSLLLKANELNAESKKELLEVERESRRSLIKPRFIHRGSSVAGVNYTIQLRNIGQRAFKVGLKVLKSERTTITSPDSNVDRPISPNEDKYINMVAIPNGSTYSGFYPEYEIDLNYQDEDSNNYVQKIKSEKGDYTISNPVLVESTGRLRANSTTDI